MWQHSPSPGSEATRSLPHAPKQPPCAIGHKRDWPNGARADTRSWPRLTSPGKGHEYAEPWLKVRRANLSTGRRICHRSWTDLFKP